MMKKIRIAIVEDAIEVQDLLITILNTEPTFQIIGVYDTKHAALTNIPITKPDIVLMDIGLPDGSGLTCIEEIKPLFPNIEFMVCTVYEDDKSILDALQAGATSYVLKRNSPQFIIQSIKELFEGGSPMNADIARTLLNKMLHKRSSSESIDILTIREIEIMDYLSKGFLYKEIASKMGITLNTLKSHCYKIYQKLQVNNKVEAINKLKY